MRRLRQDLDHATSAALLLAVVAAVLTGVLAHVWDLNDFGWHTWSGYVMAALALAHVALSWRRLASYARFRLRPRRARARRTAVARRTAASRPGLGGGQEVRVPLPRAAAAGLVSRRGLLGLGVGGVSGWLAGRGLRSPPVIAGGEDLGVVYHEWSKPGVVDALGTLADWGEEPAPYKRYRGVPGVALPAVAGSTAVHAALRERRSVRDYAGRPMDLTTLSDVLHLTAGRRDEGGRTHPSSGALYPLEMYPVVHDVDGVPSGVYHYDVRAHALSLLREGDFRGEVSRHGLMQDFLGGANVVLLVTQILQRMRPRYQDRSYRYGLLEAGHLGQNAYLAATGLGLGACAVGAFLDDEVNALLGVDGREEACVYMLSIGTVS